MILFSSRESTTEMQYATVQMEQKSLYFQPCYTAL